MCEIIPRASKYRVTACSMEVVTPGLGLLKVSKQRGERGCSAMITCSDANGIKRAWLSGVLAVHRARHQEAAEQHFWRAELRTSHIAIQHTTHPPLRILRLTQPRLHFEKSRASLPLCWTNWPYTQTLNPSQWAKRSAATRTSRRSSPVLGATTVSLLVPFSDTNPLTDYVQASATSKI